MNDDGRTRQEALRDSWVEALLVTATRRQDHADRVARAMHQIETHAVTTQRSSQTPKHARLVQWVSIAVATAVVLTLFLVLPNGERQTAMAAVQRSLNAAAELTTRKYLVQVAFQTPTGRTLDIDNDLYVRGNTHFALHRRALLPSKSFWLVQNGSEHWVVPARGPVLKGDGTLHRRWLRSLTDGSGRDDVDEQVDVPAVHVTALLTRMSSGYDLELIDDEEIELTGRGTIACQHVRAKRKRDNRLDRPDTIELWASRESGMPVRLNAQWDLAKDDVGRKSVVLTFQNDEPSLSDHWFTAEAHYEGNRPARTDSLEN